MNVEVYLDKISYAADVKMIPLLFQEGPVYYGAGFISDMSNSTNSIEDASYSCDSCVLVN